MTTTDFWEVTACLACLLPLCFFPIALLGWATAMRQFVFRPRMTEEELAAYDEMARRDQPVHSAVWQLAVIGTILIATIIALLTIGPPPQ